MTTSTLFANALKLFKRNAPEILTALGVTGVVTTAYLTAKASFQASEIIRKEEDEGRAVVGTKNRIREYGKLVWKSYIPPAISGTVTISCVVGASKASGHRTAAAVTAYSLTQKAFDEYREQVVKQLGKTKDRNVIDARAQEHVTNNPPAGKEVIITLGGEHLCCELMTGRYFKSDMQSLLKAQNDVNAMVNKDVYVALDEFYYLIGLSPTSVSGNIGWNSDKLMELEITTCQAPDGAPCLAFDYNYTKPI